MNKSKQITGLIGLLTAFILLTLYIAITSTAPIWVEAAQMLANVSSLQFHVMVDIYILVLLFCIWNDQRFSAAGVLDKTTNYVCFFISHSNIHRCDVVFTVSGYTT